MFSIFAKKNLVATLEVETRITGPRLPPEGVEETITFLLFETRYGRRSFKVYSYGHSKRREYWRAYAGPVVIWKAGGPLPDDADPNPEAVKSS